ncbi:hypothetical protein F0344_01055 [Streptomyces finlayi]|uniref:Glyceraldehyde 3-phosphate dehydrogenase NAD(P) binding domain-containing protein n=1 Tax=Streptomyces finlayi TaxID=67296 RepID=A0A7G7BDI2_9ACTN|nr:hypothetical protein F0344_01055 [Streptomyces finlayi]
MIPAWCESREGDRTGQDPCGGPFGPQSGWAARHLELAHPLTYDSAYGRLGRTVDYDEESITVAGHRIAVTSERDPADLRRGGLGVDVVVDVVIEAACRFRTREDAGPAPEGGNAQGVLAGQGDLLFGSRQSGGIAQGLPRRPGRRPLERPLGPRTADRLSVRSG